jgi:hypothetical protein
MGRRCPRFPDGSRPPRGVSWLGFFYGGNIAGAVIGSLLAGFYLMPVYDIGHDAGGRRQTSQ